MNHITEESSPMSRHLVSEDQRLTVTANLFGIQFPLRLEPAIYGTTERVASEYRGGYWLLYTLDNGGFYMAPEGEQVYHVSCMNYWRGELSADALGIVACLTAYSHLSFGGPEPFARTCAQHYHWLREYMYDHPEIACILGAID